MMNSRFKFKHRSALATLALLNLIHLSSAVAKTDIENPDNSLIEQNAELMKRVVMIKGAKGLCSGTWYETGIIITADHCTQIFDNTGTVAIQGISTTLLGMTSIKKEDASSPIPAHSNVLNPHEIGVILVDSLPLASLDLPSSPLPIIAPGATVQPGTKMLVAGYGIKKLDPQTEEEGAGKLGAAILETIDSKKGDFDLISSSKRTIHMVMNAEKGQLIEDSLKMGYTTSSLKKKQPLHSMILSGDSGGPAFIKNSANQWILAGVASAIQVSTEEGKTFIVNAQYGGKAFKFTLKNKNPGHSDLTQPITTSLERFVWVMKKGLELDLQKPLSEDLSIEETTKGEIKGFHLLLSEKTNAENLSQAISAMKAARDAVH